MKIKKLLPYKLNRILPILTIAGAGMLMNGCRDDKDEPAIPQHDTTYTWGFYNFNSDSIAPKIRASADSAQVRYVIIKSDGIPWLSGHKYNERDARFFRVEPMIGFAGEKNRHKVRGAGEIRGIEFKYPEHHKWLTDMGFTLSESMEWPNKSKQR